MNLRKFEGSRTKPRRGDIFDVQIGEFRVPGRVVSTSMVVTGIPDCIVVHLVRPVSKDWTPADRTPLQVSNLLLSPQIVEKYAWSERYFRTLARSDFGPGELLERNRFKIPPSLPGMARYEGKYFDENGDESDASDFFGKYASGSHGTVNIALSKVLVLEYRISDS